METVKICKECRAPLPADTPEGLCPKCLMKVGLGSEAGQRTASPGGRKPAPAPEEIARFFPKLDILELLGHGGMGMVYKARQPQLDRMVALKILSPELSSDPAFAERFTREAKALARLNHPSIVAVYDFGHTSSRRGNEADESQTAASPPPHVGGYTPEEGFYYFVMEYVDGVNLRQLEESRRLSPPEALAIIPKICDALQYAHEEGFVHRDIKPENILMDKKGRVKIADFGLAKILGRSAKDFALTGSQHVMGTPHYMAPEQVEHPLDVDHRADIYSLGVVFYEMLTGELPLGRFSPPSKKVQMDVRLDEVVLRTLENEPGRRYQHVSEVKSDVETISGILEKLPPHLRQAFGYEYKSKRTLWGLPLVHVSFGMDPATGKSRPAKGIIAMGGRATGVVAFGGMAVGVFAFGGLSIGLLSVGGLALGLIGIGGVAISLLLSYGGLAVAPIAMGGAAVGYYAYGGGAWGVHAVGGNVQDPVARDFFSPWMGPWIYNLVLAMVILLPLVSVFVPLILRRRLGAMAGGKLSTETKPKAKSQAWAWITALTILATASIIMQLIRKDKASSSPANSAAITEQILTEFDWQKLADEGRLLGGVPVQLDGRTALKIENTNAGPMQISLFKIEKPSITSVVYGVAGEMKYEDVQGAGYLEMWSYFSPLQPGLPEGQFFSRTLGDGGLLGKISGTSSWRTFSLPFNRTGTKNSPTRLELNLVLPGRGVVFLGPVKLVQF